MVEKFLKTFLNPGQITIIFENYHKGPSLTFQVYFPLKKKMLF